MIINYVNVIITSMSLKHLIICLPFFYASETFSESYHSDLCHNSQWTGGVLENQTPYLDKKNPNFRQ